MSSRYTFLFIKAWLGVVCAGPLYHIHRGDAAISSETKWSFSRLATFEQCPLAYKLQYIDRAPNENNAFAEYGTHCHEILEKWAKGELPDFLMASEYEEGYDQALQHSFPPFPKGMPQKYYDAGLEYFENFTGFGDQYDILAAEERFEIKIGGYPFVGIADLVLKNRETSEIEVIDHKSKSMSSMKKELNTYRKQLYVYAAFVKQKFGVFPARLRFNMFRDNTFIDEVFDEAEYNAAMAWVVDTIEKILFEFDWEPHKDKYFCRWICGVLNSCPLCEEILER